MSPSARHLSLPNRRLASWSRVLVLTGMAGSLLTLFARSWWVADLVANLRIQLLIWLLAGLAAALLSRSRTQMALAAVLLLWQASWIWSAFVFQDVSATGNQLTICTANVLTGNRRYSEITDHFKTTAPDVIAIQELSDTLNEELIRQLGYEYPFRFAEPQNDGNFGIGIFSRTPLRNPRRVEFSELHIPSIVAEVELQGRPVLLIATHPFPPSGSMQTHARNTHLKNLARFVQDHLQQEPDRCVIVVGDLNLTPWSPVFSDFLSDAGLRNGSRGCGVAPTWYRWPGFPFGLVLDHGLSTPDLVCTRRIIGRDIGSDHRPVTLTFSRRKM